MINKKDIYPIGIGTWKINTENDTDLKELQTSFDIGQNYLSLYMLYNNGEVVRYLKKYIENCGRENLFISVNLEPTIEKIEDVELQLNQYLEVLNLEYVDNLQLHSPKFSKIPLLELYTEMNRLKSIQKTRFLGISNCDLEQLKQLNENIKLDFFEGVYNLECKIYEDIGVIDYCKKNDIIFLAYQPLRRNRTSMRNYPVLVELANKYNKTQNQIILNWILKEKNIMCLIKSTNKSRIYINNTSLNFEMDEIDYKKLNDFRSLEFDQVVIDWKNTGNGIAIDQLANQFE